MKVLGNGAVYTNYGEAHPQNANSMLQHQLFHLAATRAECRVLRMATACGYVSYDEVKTMPSSNEAKTIQAPAIEGGDKPATEVQLKTIEALGGQLDRGKKGGFIAYTKQEAAETIKELALKRGAK